MSIEKCRSCGAPIRWAITEKGKRMPVDVAPSADGNIVLFGRENENEPLAKVVTKELGDDFHKENRYKSHFATCPEANKWRKKQ